MIKKHSLLLVAICIGFVTLSLAQRRPHGTVHIKNGFALGGGISQYDIYTKNLNITKGDGWVGGMSATVELPHKGYNVSWGMQLSENVIGIATNPLLVSNPKQEVEYKIFIAQLAFLWHIKLVQDFVTFDIGPMVQYNSDLELKDKDNTEDFIIDGFNTVTAGDLKNLSNLNFNAATGITLGVSHFKIRAQYIYGFTNILGGLNKEDFSSSVQQKFKGNQGMLAFTAMISF